MKRGREGIKEGKGRGVKGRGPLPTFYNVTTG